MSQDTAEGWMAVIWAAVTDSMNTWVGAVWLLAMWAVVWVAVSMLRFGFTRTKKRPSQSAAAMARSRVRQPVELRTSGSGANRARPPGPLAGGPGN